MRYTDPDGRDGILLNRSWGAYLQGHNAVLIGNDKTGWTYYSKDDTHENNKIQFSSLDDFYKWNNSDKLKASLSYDKAYRVETTPEEDEVMRSIGILRIVFQRRSKHEKNYVFYLFSNIKTFVRNLLFLYCSFYYTNINDYFISCFTFFIGNNQSSIECRE